MKKELVEEVVQYIEQHKDDIVKIMSKHLGINAEYVVQVVKPSHTSEQYIYLNMVGSEAKRQLTATPLLAQMFKDASIKIRCSITEEVNVLSFTVDVNYELNYNRGFKGCSVMSFYLNMDNGKIFVQK